MGWNDCIQILWRLTRIPGCSSCLLQRCPCLHSDKLEGHVWESTSSCPRVNKTRLSRHKTWTISVARDGISQMCATLKMRLILHFCLPPFLKSLEEYLLQHLASFLASDVTREYFLHCSEPELGPLSVSTSKFHFCECFLSPVEGQICPGRHLPWNVSWRLDCGHEPSWRKHHDNSGELGLFHEVLVPESLPVVWSWKCFATRHVSARMKFQQSHSLLSEKLKEHTIISDQWECFACVHSTPKLRAQMSGRAPGTSCEWKLRETNLKLFYLWQLLW